MKFLLAVVMILSGSSVFCADLVVTDAWSRATVPGRMGAVYATIENVTNRGIKIKGIRTDIARKAQIHESYLDDGMMRMRHRKKFLIPAGESRQLEPGGLHIMLMRLPEPLMEGSKFTLTLDLDKGDDVVVPVLVGSMGQMSKPGE